MAYAHEPLHINWTWWPRLYIHYFVRPPFKCRTSRSLEIERSFSCTCLNSISPFLILLCSLFTNNSWNYKSTSTSLKLAINVVTMLLTLSNFIGFGQLWHLFSQAANSSHSSLTFFTSNSNSLSAPYKDFFLSSMHPSKVWARACNSDYTFSNSIFWKGISSFSFIAP
jgi:hypothetical protein